MQEIWQAYFDGNHQHVIDETQSRLFATQAPDNLHLSALSMLATGNTTEGVARMRASLMLHAGAPNWFSNATIATHNAGAITEAMTFVDDGLKLYPDDSMLNYSKGNVLTALNKHVEAIAFYDLALKVDPNMVDAILNRGNCMRRTDRNLDALISYEKVLALDPDNQPAAINRIGVMIEMGRHAEAIPLLTKIVEAGGALPEATFMLSLLHLHDGNYDIGFKLYHQRWDCAMSKADSKLFQKPMAESLSAIAGKHILVSHEQGFGDSLQFIRFVPEIAKHCAKVSILCPNPLLRLFKASLPAHDVVESREQLGDYDLEVPMLDMPWLLGTTLDTLPAKHPYLTIPASLIEERKLPSSDAKMRVGLVWAGQCRDNPDLAAVDRRRSMSLDQMAALGDIENVEFISLQMGEPSTQGNTPPNGLVLHPGVRTGYDFLDTGAIIKQLDLVITVDTAPLHLAAGLNVPTWVLSRFDGCWRWLRDRTDSPWYPCITLFHQPTPGDWLTPMAEIAARLKVLAS